MIIDCITPSRRTAPTWTSRSGLLIPAEDSYVAVRAMGIGLARSTRQRRLVQVCWSQEANAKPDTLAKGTTYGGAGLQQE